MATSKRILECPYCNELLEVDPPDTLHCAYSTKKPIPKSYYKDVVQQTVECQNMECKKPIPIYWYAPLDYFCRM